MKEVYRFDSAGYYVEPVILNEDDDIPNDCTEIRPPDGLYRAKFVDGEWVEDMSPEEIEAIKNRPVEPSEIERLQEKVALQEMVIEELMFTIIPDLIGGGI